MNFEEKPYSIEEPEFSRHYWDTAFGLQKTDNLSPSAYMEQEAADHVAGRKDYIEIEQNLKKYYSEKGTDKSPNEEEADFASLRIVEILSSDSFSFSPVTLKSYHRRLFLGIESFCYPMGEYRTVNITKSEEVLNGDTVNYADFRDIPETLAYDFDQEKRFDYSLKNPRETVLQVQHFISGIWQIHPFREGNTRTCAVFLIKYLRSKGFEIDNAPFKNDARFFRDALVLANAKDALKTEKYLTEFMENLLLSGKNKLEIK